MAAIRLFKELSAFLNFAQDGFKYNLQVFPDTITAASLLFALLFQSPPFAALGGSLILLSLIHPLLARFLSSFVGGVNGTDDPMRCSGYFPGISLERLTGAASSSSFGALRNDVWPSYYATFMGFLTTYIGSMSILYARELKASPKRKASTYISYAVLALVMLIGVIYRITSGCDGLLTVVVGMASGAAIGAIVVGFLAFISERRVTNMLGFPLIRNKAADGKPIYVCERGPAE
jgi:hypothetical protein